MRRKLVVLTLLLVATVSAAGAKPHRVHIQKKNVCFNCAYCDARYCYDCIQYDC